MTDQPTLKTEFDEKALMVYYTNIVNVASGPFDFQLFFGNSYINPFGGQSGKPEITQRIQLIVQMSPHHAKAFLKALTAQVQSFELRNGEIGEPEKSQAH